MRTRFQNVRVVLPDRIEAKDILVDAEGRIEALAPPAEKTARAEEQTVSGNGGFAFPGMIDLLTHGYGSHLYGDAEPGAVAANSRALPRHGVTAFAPSFLSQCEEELLELLRQLSRQMRGDGARVLGIHSEGPCLASPGVHDPEKLLLPSAELAAKMLEAAGGHLKVMTLAPELPGTAEFVRVLREAKVSLHLGHANASPEQVPRFAEMGVHAVTHMYDVMRPAAVIDSGVYPLSLADSLLAETGLCLGLICDGVHVPPRLVKLLAQLPPERLFLETDSMKGTGMPPGHRFELYPGTEVTITADRGGRLDSGCLAGSALTGDAALRNFVKFTGADLSRASLAASLNPARLVGLDDRLGSLEPGKEADIVILAADDLSVQATYVGGREVYRAERIEA